MESFVDNGVTVNTVTPFDILITDEIVKLREYVSGTEADRITIVSLKHSERIVLIRERHRVEGIKLRYIEIQFKGTLWLIDLSSSLDLVKKIESCAFYKRLNDFSGVILGL